MSNLKFIETPKGWICIDKITYVCIENEFDVFCYVNGNAFCLAEFDDFKDAEGYLNELMKQINGIDGA